MKLHHTSNTCTCIILHPYKAISTCTYMYYLPGRGVVSGESDVNH